MIMAITEELQTRISTTERGECVFIDQFDDDVWLSVNVQGGGARVTLTREQARQMIAAIQRVLDHNPNA